MKQIYLAIFTTFLAATAVSGRNILQVECPEPAEEITWAIQEYEPIELTVGECIVFSWEGLHGIAKLNSDTCEFTAENGYEELVAPVMGGTWAWAAETPGEYYVACPVPGHCDAGQKIMITVT